MLFPVVLAVFTLFLSPPTMAGSPTLADFCENPYAALCGDGDALEKEHAAKIESLSGQIADAAWAKTLKKFPDAGTRADWEAAREAKKKFHSTDVSRLYFASLYTETHAVLGKAFEATDSYFKKLRPFLQATMEKRMADSIEPAMLEKMQKALDADKMELVNFLALMKSEDDNPRLLRELVENCGRDGMADNAFALPGFQKHYLVVCPGKYLGMFVPGRFSDRGENSISSEIWTLGHETGHFIDAEAFPDAYEKYGECLSANYAPDLEATGTSKKDVSKYMQEMSADYWGTEVLASYLSTLEDDRLKLIVLQENMEFLCGTRDDGAEDGGHPRGQFRIENLLRRNPRLHEAANCRPRPAEQTRPSCTLRGEWKKRFW